MAPKCRLGRTFPSIQPAGCRVDAGNATPVAHHPALAPYNTEPIPTPMNLSPDTPPPPSPDTPPPPSPDTPVPLHPLDAPSSHDESPAVPKKLEFGNGPELIRAAHIVPEQPRDKPTRRIAPEMVSSAAVVPTGQPSPMSLFLQARQLEPTDGQRHYHSMVEQIEKRYANHVNDDDKAFDGDYGFQVFTDKDKLAEYERTYREPVERRDLDVSDDDDSEPEPVRIRRRKQHNPTRGLRVRKMRMKRKPTRR